MQTVARKPWKIREISSYVCLGFLIEHKRLYEEVILCSDKTLPLTTMNNSMYQDVCIQQIVTIIREMSQLSREI